MEQLADEILMQHYGKGDVQAFNVLYMRHNKSVYRYFTRQCSSVAHAEELYQEVWNKLIKARERYQPSSQFSTYLYRIAHNELIDYYRRNATEKKIVTPHNDSDATHDDTVDNVQLNAVDILHTEKQIQQLKACLQQLPRDQKEAFLLKHEASLTLPEIAQLLDEPSEGIKSRIRYAINKLKHCLSHKMGNTHE
jgi:RNA polymerase sigma-70 factor (ECF subfamily)